MLLRFPREDLAKRRTDQAKMGRDEERAGSKAPKPGCIPCGRSLDKFKLLGQVGQESNLQAAVLEHAAHCPDSSRDVQVALPLCSQFCSQGDTKFASALAVRHQEEAKSSAKARLFCQQPTASARGDLINEGAKLRKPTSS